MTEKEIRAFGRRLKNWAYSAIGDRLLCTHECTKGACSWSCGGCIPLAIALWHVLEDSELYAVWAYEIPQHVGVTLNGLFIDALGARLPRSVERYWRLELDQPQVAPVSEKLARETIFNPPKIRDRDIDHLVDILIPILKNLL